MAKTKYEYRYEIANTPTTEDGSFTRIFVFNDRVRSDVALRILANDGIMVDGDRCTHSYDCCGHWYPSPVRVGKVGYRTIATQAWHQNI